MVDDTGLESLCEKANTKEEFLTKTKELLDKTFDPKIVETRKKILHNFSPIESAKKIIEVIFNQE